MLLHEVIVGCYRDFNYFNFFDSNTIDDITGFKRKKSEMLRRWDGFYTDQGWSPRQPQDFPVVPIPQYVFTNVKPEAILPDVGTTENPASSSKVNMDYPIF